MDINKICKELKKEYNATILNKYPKEKKYFMEIANKYVNSKGANNNLMKLINNLDKYDQSKNIYKYMSGPTEITILEHKKHNKRIVLFGEFHPSFPDCSTEGIYPYIGVIDYMKQLFGETTKFIDFYLELKHDSMDTHITGEDIQIGSGQTLYDMHHEFKDCMTTDYRTCKYPIRMHYVDVRDHNVANTEFIRALVGTDKVHTRKDINIYINNNKAFIHKMYSIKNGKQLQEYMIKSIQNTKYVVKEIERSNIKEGIYALMYVDELWEDMYDSFFNVYPQEFLRYATKVPLTKTLFPLYKFDKFAFSLIRLSVLIMDIYTLARMFKTFSTHKNHQPSDANNILFYGGLKHSRNLTIMIKNLGFLVVSKNISKIQSCIKSSSIPNPLF